jgi:hypothetical protein
VIHLSIGVAGDDIDLPDCLRCLEAGEMFLRVLNQGRLIERGASFHLDECDDGFAEPIVRYPEH